MEKGVGVGKFDYRLVIASFFLIPFYPSFSVLFLSFFYSTLTMFYNNIKANFLFRPVNKRPAHAQERAIAP